jgi:hypothetical protein
MTSELLVELLAKAMFKVSHEESWEQADEFTRRIYLDEAPAGVDAILSCLAEGDDAVIEAMVAAHPMSNAIAMRSALAAGMKAIANG